jgi:hypothetical protein
MHQNIGAPNRACQGLRRVFCKATQRVRRRSAQTMGLLQGTTRVRPRRFHPGPSIYGPGGLQCQPTSGKDLAAITSAINSVYRPLPCGTKWDRTKLMICRRRAVNVVVMASQVVSPRGSW